MTRPVQIGEDVERDIVEAAEWYDDQRLGLGDELVALIESAIERIAERPFAFPRVHGETRRAMVRTFPYSVYFRVHDDRIVILAVEHGSRDPDRWRSRS